MFVRIRINIITKIFIHKVSKLYISFEHVTIIFTPYLTTTSNSFVKVVKTIFCSEPPDTENNCLPEDVIELLTDVEHVCSE
jgi:hypothetical protein